MAQNLIQILIIGIRTMSHKFVNSLRVYIVNEGIGIFECGLQLFSRRGIIFDKEKQFKFLSIEDAACKQMAKFQKKLRLYSRKIWYAFNIFLKAYHSTRVLALCFFHDLK